MKYTNYVKKILTSKVYNVVKETPLEYGYSLSQKPIIVSIIKEKIYKKYFHLKLDEPIIKYTI